MKSAKLFWGIVLAAGVARADISWFGVNFAGYAPGQALSNAGATGGTWVLPLASGPATNVFDGVRNGIAIDTTDDSEVRFQATEATGKDIERIDFSFCAESIGAVGHEDFDGVAGLAPTVFSDGRFGFSGFTLNGWIELSGEGIAPEPGAWLDGRIEMRTLEDLRLISYLVKNGDAWVRLKDAKGVTWFRTRVPAEDGKISSVSFSGKGRFSDLSGREDDGEALKLYKWVGGNKGDWNTAANWTVAGEPAESAPAAAGDYAYVSGTVNLTRGSESGTATDILVLFKDEGLDVLGGDVDTAVSIDLSRPRLGKKLEATWSTLFGLAPAYTISWRRASGGSPAGTSRSSYSEIATGTSYKPSAADLEHWLKFTAKNGDETVLEKEFFMSRLPVLYMTTDDGATPTKNKEEHTGYVYQQGNDDWKSLYDGKMVIKVRGNSTSSYPKKPWKLKLDKKTKMFDIPKSKHWVLLANYNDQSMLRNKLAYDFANEIGSLGMKSTWVECVLNGEWQGTYQFGEHIRIDKDRVNVHDWEGDAGDLADAFGAAKGLTDDQIDALATQLEQNFAWVTGATFSYYDATNKVTLTGKAADYLPGFETPDISGGYLWEFSEEYDERAKFKTVSGVLNLPTMLKSPEYLDTNTQMMNYCKDFFQKYWDACTSFDGYNGGEDKWIGDYCDFDSMVNYWLVMEMMGNNDAVKKSRYASKDQGAKLVWGPVWDFDWGMGSARVSATGTGWKCEYEKTESSIYKEWTDHPEFCTRAVTRYWQIRPHLAAMLGNDGLIAQYTNLLVEACHANSTKWNVDYNKGAGNFEADVSRLVNYLEARLPWLDQQFASVATLMSSVQRSECTHYYTPDATKLPIAFSGLNRHGTLYSGHPLRTRFTPGATVATISVFVNGIRQVTKQAPAGGVFDAVLPPSAFTRPLGEPNCISFVAYDASGTVLARNYDLVTRVSPATVLILR